jgi:nucleoid-associated protein YgaU
MVASGYTPRARLRDEAPRPLEIELHRPAPKESIPQPTNVAVAQPASFDDPIRAPVNSSIELPPWPSEEEANIGNTAVQATITRPEGPSQIEAENGEPRTHIVVDGDSLERLAGLYLDDPRRAGEIYQANRELLTTPDLLPIGVELKIPNRSILPAIDSLSPQSFVPRAVAVHSSPTTPSALVPVRPVPGTSDVVPRAQLANPLPVQ